MEIYTQQTKWLQDFNLEIQQKLLSMPSCMEQVTEKSGMSLEEQRKTVRSLKQSSLIIRLHLELYENRLTEEALKVGLEV